MDSTSGSIFLLAFFVLITGIPGAYLLVQRKRGQQRQALVRSWPATDGVVTGASISEHKRRSGRRGLFNAPLRNTYYQPVIRYTYRVGGAAYEGSRYKNGWGGDWMHPDRARVEAVLNQHPDGKQVKVHYDPADPAQAYLEVQETDANLTGLGVSGLIFAAIALAVLGYGLFAAGGNIAGRMQSAGLEETDALIPLSASQLKARFETDLGLTCSSWTSRGPRVEYGGWRCVQQPNDDFPQVIIWSRGKGDEKVDLVEVSAYQDQAAGFQAILTQLIPIVFTGQNHGEASQWAADQLPPQKAEGKTSAVFNNIPLSIDSGETFINLWIGEAK